MSGPDRRGAQRQHPAAARPMTSTTTKEHPYQRPSSPRRRAFGSSTPARTAQPRPHEHHHPSQYDDPLPRPSPPSAVLTTTAAPQTLIELASSGCRGSPTCPPRSPPETASREDAACRLLRVEKAVEERRRRRGAPGAAALLLAERWAQAASRWVGKAPPRQQGQSRGSPCAQDETVSRDCISQLLQKSSLSKRVDASLLQHVCVLQ